MGGIDVKDQRSRPQSVIIGVKVDNRESKTIVFVKNASRYRKPLKLLSSVLVCFKTGCSQDKSCCAVFGRADVFLIMYRGRPAKRELQQSGQGAMNYFFAAGSAQENGE